MTSHPSPYFEYFVHAPCLTFIHTALEKAQASETGMIQATRAGGNMTSHEGIGAMNNATARGRNETHNATTPGHTTNQTSPRGMYVDRREVLLALSSGQQENSAYLSNSFLTSPTTTRQSCPGTIEYYSRLSSTTSRGMRQKATKR